MEKTTLRIIGGEMRSRKLQLSVDPRTRPMKDRTREAVMNLLGGTFSESIAFDLFAGTAVLAFESLSRGVERAIAFEILRSAVEEVQANAKTLGVADRLIVLQKDVIKWSQKLTDNLPFLRLSQDRWIVFCCPPYALWKSQGEELKSMIDAWIQAAPPRSLFAIELEFETPVELLPTSLEWDIRQYKPAQMAIGEKEP